MSKVSNGFSSYQQFQNEILRTKAGPLISAVEDIADEMFQLDFNDEFDSMWDKAADDDE
ncbi:MAG: hypothetical protein H7Z43_14460 [Clostridia bacterium]|nr:hypothetical protein [Deltaproteobacteria bacterium]